MAIKVQGTTVIDDSRNLQNLGNLNTTGNVYANTFVGDASQLTNLPASGGTYEATASGTLANGDTVIVNSDGTVSAISVTDFLESVGTPEVFNSGHSRYMSAVYDSNAQKVVIAYQDNANSNYGTAVVGTVSGTTISFGTPVVFESASSYDTTAVYDASAQKVVIAYRDLDNSNAGTAIVGTISGTSISFGTPTVFQNNGASYIGAVYDPNAQKVVVAYRNTTSPNYGTAIVGTVSGTSISFGTATVFESASIYYASPAYDVNAQRVVIGYRDDGNSFYGTAVVGTVSGTSISFGTPVVFNSGSSNYMSTVYDSNAQKVVIAYTGRTDSDYVTAIVGTVSDTSISFGTAAALGGGNAAHVSAAYDDNAQKVIVAYQDGSNIDYGTVAAGTVSGTSISFATPIEFESAASRDISATYDSNAQKVVIAYKDQGNSNYGTAVIYTAESSSTNLTTENYIGISDAAYADGTTATIQIKGAVDDAQSGLTPGQQYFVQANGSINTTAADPSVFAGTAIASNKLIVKG